MDALSCSSLRERGYGLVEILVVLALSMIIIGMSFPVLRLAKDVYARIRGEEEIEAKMFTAMHVIEQGVQDSRGLYSVPAFRIHSEGVIEDTFGEKVIKLSSNSDLKPDANSNGMSFLVTKPEQMLTVLSQEGEFLGSRSVKLCSNFPEAKGQSMQREIKKDSNWIGFSVDGVAEYIGSVRIIRHGDESCLSGTLYVGSLSYLRPLMFVGPEIDLNANGIGHVLAFVPVKDSYALYVAQNGELRRMSHLTKENQPIVTGIKRLKASLLHENDYLASYEISLTLSSPVPIERRFTIVEMKSQSHSILDVVL